MKVCEVCGSVLGGNEAESHLALVHGDKPKKEAKPPVLVPVTVAKIVTDKQVMSAEAEVAEVLSESVSCPRVLTDGTGEILCLFVSGQVYELRRSTLPAVLNKMNKNGSEDTLTLAMFDVN